MNYRCRLDESTTLSYSGKTVYLTYNTSEWGRDESSSVPITNIPLLIKALQDIQSEISYDNW